jgi:hypothetical protein
MRAITWREVKGRRRGGNHDEKKDQGTLLIQNGRTRNLAYTHTYTIEVLFVLSQNYPLQAKQRTLFFFTPDQSFLSL